MSWPPPLGSLGAILAILVIVVAVVFIVLGRLDPVTGGMLVALGVSRLT